MWFNLTKNKCCAKIIITNNWKSDNTKILAFDSIQTLHLKRALAVCWKKTVTCSYIQTDTVYKNCNPHHETFLLDLLFTRKFPITFVPSLLHCLFLSITCSLAVIIIYKSSFTSSIIIYNICAPLLTHSLMLSKYLCIYMDEWWCHEISYT